MSTKTLALQCQQSVTFFVHNVHCTSACTEPIHPAQVCHAPQPGTNLELSWFVTLSSMNTIHLLELRRSSAVDDVVNLGTARIKVELQHEHDLVRDAEALANNCKVIHIALLLHWDPEYRLGLIAGSVIVGHVKLLQVIPSMEIRRATS